MNNTERLTTKEFWINDKTDPSPGRHEDGHGIDLFIKKYIPVTTTGTCLEIGSFPGSHLATFGDLGYELNGIDFHPANKTAVPQWLQKEGYKTGLFETADFFEYSFDKKFDVVCSFGFIEHFKNYQDVIAAHAALVKPGGYLLLTTPNFKGSIQHFLHKNFDRTNLAAHNLQSMQPEKWKSANGLQEFDVKYEGFFGGFWFWRAPENHGPVKRKLLWVIERTIPRMRKILSFESSAFSAYCGMAAQKHTLEDHTLS